MSTKPIREALEWLPEMASRMPTDSTKQAVTDEYAAALEAVRTIEEMAKSIVSNGGRRGLSDSMLLDSIAKEAP